MATTTQIVLSADAQEKVLRYVLGCQRSYAGTYNTRDYLESADRTYMRELDFSIDRWKGEMAKRRGDVTKFQNIVLPVALPQVESAVTFQSEMFLSGFPIFGVVADPDNMDAATAMDTIIGEQQIRGKWALEFQKAFRNGFKYNTLAMSVDWVREHTFAVPATQVEEQLKLTEVIWEGNAIRNMDMYNTFHDVSVSAGEVSTHGEFAGYMELFSGIRLKRWLLGTLGSVNHKEALTSGSAPGMGNAAASTSFYFPKLNHQAIIRPDTVASTSWAGFWAGDYGTDDVLAGIYKGRFQLTTMYCRICPKDFGITKVPSPTVPQLWKFCIVNNRVLVLAERLTNAHDKLPIVMAHSIDDGMGYQTKSLQKNVEPMQEMVTALANSSVAARRRAISDRALYDPSRIAAKDINNDNPTAKIPVRASAFGSNIGDAYHPIPFVDDQFQLNSSDMSSYMAFADQITGMNQARQGQFTKGNRTRAEFSSIMANGSGRDRTTSQSLECSLMTPIKEILKANILQFQGGTKLFNPERREVVEVDPVKLRKAMLVFKMSDGLLPSERIMDSESLTIAMQTLQAVPELAQGYNIVPMFSYIMKSRGAKLKPFEKTPEQLAYEQAMQQWQQAIAAAGQQVAQAIQKSGADITVEDIQALIPELPPQPKPEDYGYDPQQVVQAEDGRSVFAQTNVGDS